MLRFEEAFRIVNFFGFTASVIFCAGVLSLLPSYLPLMLQQKEEERALRVEEEAAKKLKSEELIIEAAKGKALARSLEGALKTRPRAHALLEELFSDAQEINVLMISLNKDGNVALTGFAQTRDDLLQFEKMLRESEHFQDISFPLSNIIQEADITFSMRARLGKEYGL